MKTPREIAIKAIEHSIFCDADILTEYYNSADEYFEKNFGCTVDEAETVLDCKFAVRDYWPDSSIWGEIKADFYDEEEKKLYVDAWKTEDDCEEGIVIAKIDFDGNIEYLDERARTDSYAQTIIAEALVDIIGYKAYDHYIKIWCAKRGYNPSDRDPENGFGGEDYVCFEEFLDCEFQNESFIRGLFEKGFLNEKEFEIWKESRKD